MTPGDFAALVDVSRETVIRLETYLDLIRRWQRAINLVGPSTLDDPWRRHILDSAQLLRHLPATPAALYDLGSGAGLPGMVLAIMGHGDVHLVESDRRKVQFLKEAARVLDLSIAIHEQRIEALPAACATVITARALAPLPVLLDLAAPLLQPGGQCLFLKGRRLPDELTEARKCWRMTNHSFASLSEPSASVLKLWDIERAPLHRE
ncbi:MAG: 16S rRNA (guanine(527)-N(7))-methyltransferase RsmG [Rhizobiales bacterium]|nr:16S rRNA (guanine(527)-N(7))-methyltransferase RsmG [Hyphomicrobiales bacterium]